MWWWYYLWGSFPCPVWLWGESESLILAEKIARPTISKHLLPWHALLLWEDVFWGGFIGPAPCGREHLNTQQLLMNAMLVIRTAWRGAAALHSGGLE